MRREEEEEEEEEDDEVEGENGDQKVKEEKIDMPNVDSIAIKVENGSFKDARNGRSCKKRDSYFKDEEEEEQEEQEEQEVMEEKIDTPNIINGRGHSIPIKMENGLHKNARNGRSCKKRDSYKFQDDDEEIESLLDDEDNHETKEEIVKHESDNSEVEETVKAELPVESTEMTVINCGS